MSEVFNKIIKFLKNMIRRILIGETKKNRTISFTSAPNNLAYGATGTVTAVPSEGVGDGTITYSSSDTSVASISGTTISATGVGTCTITAYISEGSSYHEASATYTFTCVKANRTLSWTSQPNNLEKGNTGTLTATPSAGSGDGTITYSSSNSSIASVSGSTITAQGAGTATITATISAGTNYNSASTSYTITCTNIYNGHSYVDLGLPSGTKWATMNVGASSETSYGNYYMYGKGTRTYNSSDSIYEGAEDPLSMSVDTARQVWGGQWHMPTRSQCQELIDNCTCTWTTSGGVNGCSVSKNGKSIFFPAGGRYYNGSQSEVGTVCRYWSSSPSYLLRFYSSGSKDVGSAYRGMGVLIRGVVV